MQTREASNKQQRVPAETELFHQFAFNLTSGRRLATFQID
ncbi:hypothetical protein SynBIOSU31_01480 [Synechococcus sp. BIOS-U3-1]|nr:hypothetical protein SynBIOSU31_01480 [Synechococcus sp. BIOS-U3-1]